jgi:hypothetical protein
MHPRREVKNILIRNVKNAQLRQREAGDRFRQLTSNVPHLVALPDAVNRVRLAGMEYRNALRDLRAALVQYQHLTTPRSHGPTQHNCLRRLIGRQVSHEVRS